jgi:hypothetical protein
MNSVARLALILTLAVAPLAAGAVEPQHAIIESSVETTGAGVHFPDSLRGKIDLIGCDKCAGQSLQLQSSTTFTLNGAQITLAQMRSAAAGAGDKQITIHFRLADRLVTRVDLVSF